MPTEWEKEGRKQRKRWAKTITDSFSSEYETNLFMMGSSSHLTSAPFPLSCYAHVYNECYMKMVRTKVVTAFIFPLIPSTLTAFFYSLSFSYRDESSGNDSEVVIVFGGVQWLALQHINLMFKALARYSNLFSLSRLLSVLSHGPSVLSFST